MHIIEHNQPSRLNSSSGFFTFIPARFTLTFTLPGMLIGGKNDIKLSTIFCIISLHILHQPTKSLHFQAWPILKDTVTSDWLYNYSRKYNSQWHHVVKGNYRTPTGFTPLPGLSRRDDASQVKSTECWGGDPRETSLEWIGTRNLSELSCTHSA